MQENRSIVKFVFVCVLVLVISITGTLIASKYLNVFANKQVHSSQINNEQDDVHGYIKLLNERLKLNELSIDDGYVLIDNLFKMDEQLSNMKYADNLKTGWIKVEDKAVNEYTFYFSNCMVSRIKYCEYVDENKNIVKSDYANCSEVIREYKYEEEFRYTGEKGLDYTVSQNYNTIEFNEESDSFQYTGHMKFYNIEDYVCFGDPEDYGNCSDIECVGCVECIRDWTRCIKRAMSDVIITGGVVYFPTREYLVDVDDDSGLEYEILPNGKKSSFDAKKTYTDRGRGISLVGNFVTYQENIVDIPKGFAPIIIDFCGSKLKLEKNHVANYRIIEVRDCKYFEVKNGTVQGDRMEHDYTEFLYDGVQVHPQSGDAGDHTQGYGISIKSTENAIVSNMDVYDLTADALAFNKSVLWTNGTCIGNETNVEVKYTFAHHSRRQGITIGDIDSVNIHHTEIAYIGGGNRLNSDGTYSLEIGWASKEDEEKYGGLLSSEEKNLVGTLGVGRNPMAGIDIEPDRGSRLAEKIIVNNVYIHTTDGFSIVGVGSSSCHHTTGDLLISNSFIDGFICLSEDQDEYVNGVFYPAEKILLKNNIILHSDPVVQIGYELDENLQGKIDVWCALETTNITYSQCIIRKTFKGHMSFFNVGNTYDGCLVEQDKDSLIYLENPQKDTFTPNGYFRFSENCNIVNTTFRNLIGAQVNSSYWYAHGVVFVDNGLGNNYGNTFDNCSVMLNSVTLGKADELSICDVSKASKFYGGMAYIYSGGKTILNNCTFVTTKTKATAKHIEMNYCVFLNTDTIFGDNNGDARADRLVNNCYFQFDNESMFSSRLNRGTHWGGTWKDSVIRIENDVTVSNLKCKYTGEAKVQPHFTFMSMTDLDDVLLTQISLNRNMQTKASLLYRNNEYSTKDSCHTGSHNYAGLCFYDGNEWLDYVREQASINSNKIYLLAYKMMLENGYY